jgi:DNA-binding MarR family transcriptional regulator
MSDLPLFAHARKTDRQTSHEAAADATKRIRDSQMDVLGLFGWFEKHWWDDAHTDTQLIEIAERTNLRQSDSGIRTRRSELVKAGLVESVGTTKIGNRRHTLWALTDAGREALRRMA